MSPKKLASLLGQLARGKPKNYSKAERLRRQKRMREVQKLRWK